MSDMIAMTLDEAEAFAIAALTASGASEINARAQAVGGIGAELDGIKSHSFPYVPIYCEHLLCGKVKGYAEPQLKRLSDAAFMVDAANGFAHPAINTGLESFAESLEAQEAGVVHVDWRPPAGGNEELMSILERMKGI